MRASRSAGGLRAGRPGAPALALALAAAGCSGTAAPTAGPGSPGAGIVVVTDGGTGLVDGATDVPPTLDLRIDGGAAVNAATTAASLDGRPLPLRDSAGAVVATTSPLPLGSAHTLVLRLPGRHPQEYRFQVVAPAQAFAAAHREAGAAVVLDLALSLAPADPAAVTAAVPPGGSPGWLDSTHLRAAWPRPPTAAHLHLPAGLPAARGSRLGGALDLDLSSAPPAGTLRTALAGVGDARAPVAPSLPVVAFTTSTAASRTSLEAHAAQVSVISPTGLTAGADGGLAGAPDAVAVAVARQRGIPLLPLVQNAGFAADAVDGLLRSPPATARLVAALRAAASAGGWGGVHLDLENVPASDRDALSGLVARLADGMHADGRRLDVAVVPHRPGHVNALNAAYDLAAIGRSADRVTLMAYEEHSASTDPGPVAGLAWDGQVLDGSLPALGDPGRALLGLPLYARSWDGSGSADADGYAHALGQALALPGGARVDYDFLQGTPSVGPPGGGAPVTWFDDAASLARKIALGRDRRVGGIAVWRLGFEDPAFWGLLPAAGVPAPG